MIFLLFWRVTYYFSGLVSQNGECREAITQAFGVGCIGKHSFASQSGPGSGRLVPGKGIHEM